MTSQCNLFRDEIDEIAAHIETCIVKAMGGRYVVVARSNGRIRIAHAGRPDAQDPSQRVNREIYTAQTPRSRIVSDLEHYVCRLLKPILVDKT